MFSQNNESATKADQFLGKYGRSAALISYWLNGIPTLEENNLVTNPFYLYFFRNLFTQHDDYYMTNLNFFTVPQMHLYPMLGVRNLVSDMPTESGDQLILAGTPFFRKNFENYNFGQYAPKHPVRVASAREAIRIMGESSFNSIEEFVIMDDTFVPTELSKGSIGRIQYQDNGIKFFGNSKGKTLHVLPVVFSNCLVAENGSRLIRVNLLLTGIIFEGQISEKISYQGPPFRNSCLKKDISDVEEFNLRDREYAYPEKADKPTFNSLRDFMNWVDPIFRW
jgi:hypothetical protein